MGLCCRLGKQTGALGQPRGVGLGERWERDGGGPTYIYLRLIHADVWQKPTLFCKAIIFQLKINKSFNYVF